MASRLLAHGVELAALFVYSVIYGVYLVTFSFSMYLLLRKRRTATKSRSSWIFMVASFLLFALLAIKTACNVCQAFQTFVLKLGAGKSGVSHEDAVSSRITAIEVSCYASITSQLAIASHKPFYTSSQRPRSP